MLLQTAGAVTQADEAVYGGKHTPPSRQVVPKGLVETLRYCASYLIQLLSGIREEQRKAFEDVP